MEPSEIAEKIIEMRVQQRRFASEIEDQKKIESDARAKIDKRLEGVEEFIFRGNGHEPASVRLSLVESFVETAEKFIMAHESKHETLDTTIKGIIASITTAKAWIAAAIFFGSIFGTVAGFLLNLYFKGKP